MLKRTAILFFLIFLNREMSSQVSSIYIAETRLILQSKDIKGEPFTPFIEFAYMVLNTATGEFKLTADLYNIRTGDAYIDSTIKLGGQQPIIYKGNIGENLLLLNQQVNDEKTYTMQGQLMYNGISTPALAEFDPINFGEKNDPKNYRMNFKLTLDSTKITLIGLETKIHNQLVFEIIDGKLNTQP